MWLSACRVCDNILDYQPDLVLVLMHSGWGPVFAAQALWQLTQSRPFPPVARSNIGREKIGIFENAHHLDTTSFFVGEYSSTIDIGKLLAWLTSRTDWREQLRQQVAEVMPSANDPGRILVVDDTIHEGSTAILTLGLLEWSYPQADVRFLNADSWYRSDYREFMLAALVPGDELFPDGKLPSDEVKNHLASVAVGSENVAEDSLCWQPVSLDSPAVQALSSYRPARYWMMASRQIYSIIAREVASRAAGYVRKATDLYYLRFELNKTWLIMRDVWLYNGITRRQVEQRYGLSTQEVKRLLGSWVEYQDVVITRRGRWARYVIPDPIQQYMNKQVNALDDSRESYWLLPGRLMFGSSVLHATNPEAIELSRQAMCSLLDTGVDCWLDVQIIQEDESPQEHPLFVEEARAIGRQAIAPVVPLALQFVSEEGYIRERPRRPNRKDIRRVLDLIENLLGEGRVIYLSASTGSLRGILAGCYLARHGQTGAAALRALQARRATGPNGWKREPASVKARRYVCSWPAGL